MKNAFFMMITGLLVLELSLLNGCSTKESTHDFSGIWYGNDTRGYLFIHLIQNDKIFVGIHSSNTHQGSHPDENWNMDTFSVEGNVKGRSASGTLKSTGTKKDVLFKLTFIDSNTILWQLTETIKEDIPFPKKLELKKQTDIPFDIIPGADYFSTKGKMDFKKYRNYVENTVRNTEETVADLMEKEYFRDENEQWKPADESAPDKHPPLPEMVYVKKSDGILYKFKRKINREYYRASENYYFDKKGNLIYVTNTQDDNPGAVTKLYFYNAELLFMVEPGFPDEEIAANDCSIAIQNLAREASALADQIRSLTR